MEQSPPSVAGAVHEHGAALDAPLRQRLVGGVRKFVPLPEVGPTQAPAGHCQPHRPSPFPIAIQWPDLERQVVDGVDKRLDLGKVDRRMRHLVGRQRQERLWARQGTSPPWSATAQGPPPNTSAP